MLVAYLVETHGDEKLRAFVRSFGEGLDDEAALTRAYGRTWATLQPEFDAYVKQKYDAVVPALTERRRHAARPHGDGGRLAGLCRQPRRQLPHPDGGGHAAAASRATSTAPARCSSGRSTLVPFATGEASPWRLLVTDRAPAGTSGRRAPFHGAGARTATTRRCSRCASSWRRRVDPTDAALRQRAAERLIEIDPFDAAAHTALGDLALARGDVPVALRELQAAVDAGPPNPAEALTSLAEAHPADGAARPGQAAPDQGARDDAAPRARAGTAVADHRGRADGREGERR